MRNISKIKKIQEKMKCKKQDGLYKLNQFQRESGITLVALVCTIVILLILSGMTIMALFGDNGIINSAKKAKEMTKRDEEKTQQGLEDLADSIVRATDEYAWKLSSDGKKVVNKNHPDGIEIGDYVNYDCKTGVAENKKTYTSLKSKNGYADQTFNVDSYNYGWRVLGVDNKGQLLLISEEMVPITIATNEPNTFNDWLGVGETRGMYFIQGKAGYENGINELKNISKLYGQGKGTTGGTVLTIDEINKMTGLNGNNIDGNGTKFGVGELHEYGNKVTYYWDGTANPYYVGSNGKTGKLENSHNTFNWFDENNVFHTSTKPTDLTTQITDVKDMKKITTLTSTYYDYTASTGMDTNSKAYKMLFANSSTGELSDYSNYTDGVRYYLGSSSVYQWTSSSYAHFCLCTVYDGIVAGYGENWGQYYSNGADNLDYSGVRPVVSLKSNISLVLNGEGRDNCNLYDIVGE